MKKFILPLLIAFSFENILASKAQTLDDEAVSWLQEYLQVDTVNPPGNESRAVDFYAKIFKKEGIKFNSAESAPGRGNIWARIKGGDKPALILLQHTDVVPANMNFWTRPAFSGEIHEEYIWGRGALDMKGTGISQLAVFLSLHRSGLALNRDVVFLATADEEAGGAYGAGWMVDNHPEVFEGAGLLINEGGSGYQANGKIIFGVEVTQKVPVWLRLTAVDTPGHGSSPRPTSSVTRIVEALNIVKENPFKARIIPEVERIFKSDSKSMDGEFADKFFNIKESIKQEGFLEELQEYSASRHALTRDTCSMTRMGGSSKINVIPPEAWAEIDCRILPDRPAEEFIETFNELVKDTGVKVEVIMAFTSAISPTDSDLFKAIEEVMSDLYPNSSVVPSVSTGFTDSHFTRDLGIASYGFNPLIGKGDEFSGVHGNDEKVNEAAFRQGVLDLKEIIQRVVND
ncbi:M20/M25/M40 family metallo-hydrolase [Gammaproteobacteria bacterium]|nr:M20/M25/M40 family metallo-hydrolase [Gammaproteobacteria bacterium]